MLITYTPNEQTDEAIEQVKDVIGPSRRDVEWSEKTDSGFLFSFTTSWCRELTINSLLGLVGGLPPGKLNIYGIRKHDECWSNQPGDIRGEIKEPNNLINILFTNLFQFMTEMLSHTLETEQPFDSHSILSWSNHFGRSKLFRPSLGDSQCTMKCLLNLDEESIPETSLWKDGAMYGTMCNIPSEWAKSQATMSYLLYIPRVWGSFYENLHILEVLIKSGRLKYDSGGKLARLLDEGQAYYEGKPSELWKLIARQLMLPMWFTECGGVDFWTFTYMVIREGIAVKGGLPRIPGFQEALYSIECSGFLSWLREYRCQLVHKASDWVLCLHGILQTRGYHAILRPRSIIPYV